MNEAIGSCVGLYLMIGVAAAVIGAALLALFGIYEIPSSFQTTAHLAFGLMVAQVSAGFVGILPEGIMFAHHDFVVRNLVRVGGVLLRMVLTIALLAVNASLVAMALIQLLCLAFDVTLSLIVVRRRYPEVRGRLAGFGGPVVRRDGTLSPSRLPSTAGAR